MNEKVKCHGRGGVFSILGGGLEGIRQSVECNSISEVYVFSEAHPHKAAHAVNPFDFVLIQNDPGEAESYNKHASHFLNCDEKMLDQYASIVSKIKFKKELMDLVDHYTRKFQIDENTVGVHYRLTDLNRIHPQYGEVYFEDYKNCLEGVIQDDHKLFVASDNEESITKVLSVYKDKVTYVPDLLRSKNQYCTEHTAMQEREILKDTLIKESFLEALLLSRCGVFLYRSSTMSVFVKVLRRILGKNNNIKIGG